MDMIDYLSLHLTESEITFASSSAVISAFVFKSRKSLGMTKQAFAKMLGVTPATVAKWESGDYNFTLKTISELAEKLNATFCVNLISRGETVCEQDIKRC